MSISKIAVNNKATVYVLLLLIVVGGIFSYVSLPKEASPSITIPYVFVSTAYFGVSPEDMENLVTQKIENEIKSLSDIKNITSISQESFSFVTIEFNTNVNIEDALQKVRDKVSVAKTKMPADIEEPNITEINLSEQPILYISLSGNFGLYKLKEIGEELEDKIETIPGVLSVDLTGGLEREVKINADANKLRYYNISFGDIINTVNFNNKNIPGGGIEIGSSSYTVRVPGEVSQPEDFANLTIKAQNDKPIFVRDVADVEYSFKDRTTFARRNGVEAVTLVIKKSSGENIIEVINRVKNLIDSESKSLPSGLSIGYTGDQSKMIEVTVHELENGITTGVILVTLILFMAMGIRTAFLVALSIPLSFFIAFIILSMLGITMNMIVLFSLILVLGIIVDDAIVVTENIYRLQDKENFNPHDAAIEGPREVQIPVLIATLTIISSFFPLLFFPGIVGEFMKYLPITLIVCLFSSLFVALVFSPVFASTMINVKEIKKSESGEIPKWKIFTWLHHKFDNWFDGFSYKYERFIHVTMRHRKTTLIGVFALFILVIILFGTFNKGVEFFPTVEPNTAYIYITTPVGSSIELTNKITQTIEQQLPQFKDVEYFVSNVGQEIRMGSSGGKESNKSTITISFFDKEDRNTNSLETVEKIREAVTGITTAEVIVDKQNAGPPTGPPVNIEISGPDFKQLGEIADDIKRKIADVRGISDLEDNFEMAKPELRFKVDRQKASLYGLNITSIASTIRTAVNGTEATKFRIADDEYDVTVRLDSAQRNNIENIKDLFVTDKDGFKVPISSVADVEFAGGLGAIRRVDLKRVVTVSANSQGRLGNDVLMDVQNILKNYELPDGYQLKYTGEQEDQQETSAFLFQAFFISVFLVFFFLVLEFNKIGTSLLIMLTIILSMIGVLIGLMVVQIPFGIVMTGIGIIALAGIVVRNAIVLLDFQKILERQGLSLIESTVISGRIRLRPVILTALTTILGVVPLTTGVDFDWRSLSWVIGAKYCILATDGCCNNFRIGNCHILNSYCHPGFICFIQKCV